MNEAVKATHIEKDAKPILEIENLSISFFTRKGEIPAVMDFSCTVLPGEDSRAGRWRGWDKTECGIHASTLPPSKDGELPPGYEPVF